MGFDSLEIRNFSKRRMNLAGVHARGNTNDVRRASVFDRGISERSAGFSALQTHRHLTIDAGHQFVYAELRENLAVARTRVEVLLSNLANR